MHVYEVLKNLLLMEKCEVLAKGGENILAILLKNSKGTNHKKILLLIINNNVTITNNSYKTHFTAYKWIIKINKTVQTITTV